MNAGERLAAYGLALPDGHTLVPLAEPPDLVSAFSLHNGAVWPEFMFHDALADPPWATLDTALGARDPPPCTLSRCYPRPWSGGRVVDGSGLENRRAKAS